nr:copper resistance protein CopC [Clavibacter michiganensis]
MASPHHPRTPSLLRRAALAAGAAALVLGGALIPAGAASAHDRLVGSTPAADATVTDEPGTIALDFSEELLALDAQASGFAIQVVNASDGSFHEDGCVAVDGSTATTRIALGTAGTYQVTWRAVSSDSHPIDGTYSFTYAPTGDTTGTPAITSAPACGDAWAGSAATATPEEIADAAGEIRGVPSFADAAGRIRDQIAALPPAADALPAFEALARR